MERRGEIAPWIKPWPQWERHLADLFDWDVPAGWPRWMGFARGPSIDLYETENEVVVEAEVPGFSPEDITVQVGPYGVHLKGSMTRREDVRRDDYYIRERRFGEFSRSISFPTPVAPDKARALFKDGILKIVAPKRITEQNGVRRVPVQREEQDTQDNTRSRDHL